MAKKQGCHLDESILRNIQTLLKSCAGVRAAHRVLIITDETTCEIGKVLAEQTSKIARHTKEIFLEQKTVRFHGTEPPQYVAKAMLSSDVVFCLTRMSMAHTQSRAKASQKGVRFLSLPGYSWQLLARPSLAFDFRKASPLALKLSRWFSAGKRVFVRTPRGTDISFSIEGRHANNCPGWCWKKGVLASPPDAEVNIAPQEGTAHGVIVVDGSIPHEAIGLMKKPAIVEVHGGAIVSIKGYKKKALESIFFNKSSEAERKILGEFGMGLNANARLCGIMLEDEGMRGTGHFGFGSNATIGGKNKVAFHLDMVVKDISVIVDNTTVMSQGQVSREGD